MGQGLCLVSQPKMPVAGRTHENCPTRNFLGIGATGQMVPFHPWALELAPARDRYRERAHNLLWETHDTTVSISARSKCVYEWMIDLNFIRDLLAAILYLAPALLVLTCPFKLKSTLCNFHPFTPDCAQKYGLASNQTLAHVCPSVSHRVMKSVFPFLLLPAPALDGCQLCALQVLPQAKQPPHQLSAFLSTHFCFPICSKSWLAHLSPFSPCPWSVWFPSLCRAKLTEVQRTATPSLSTHLGSEHTAHAWINLQMPITDLPAELMREGFEGPR